MQKKFREIESSSVDSPGKYSTFHKKIQDFSHDDPKIYEGGTLEEFTIETEGPPRIQPRGPAEIKTDPYEGNYPTMAGEHLKRKHGYTNVGGGSDYYYTGSKDNPMVIGEVDIEGGKVTGLYGDDPSFYGPEKEHQRKK